MVQEQLVDYVSSQMKLGVSRDAIKSALVSAGWVSTDVEDTLKKVEGGGSAVAGAVSRPATASQPASSMMATKPVVMGGMPSTKNAEPQMIRVSDLVSSSSPASSSMSSSASSVAKPASKDSFFGGKISGNSFQATSASGGGAGATMSTGNNKKGLIGGIVAVIFVLIFAGVAWYFYSGSAALSAQVASLNSQSASVASQLSTLKSQMDASTTDLSSQVAALTAANADLALDLSFYAVPPAPAGTSSTPVTALPVTLSGALSGGGKAPYAITTAQGAKVFVANSADATVSSQLKPLVGQTIQLAGTYMPGSDQMTVTSVSTSTTQ